MTRASAISKNVISEDQQAKAAVKMYLRLCNAWKLNSETASKFVLVDSYTWDLMKDGKWEGKFNEEQKIRIGALFELNEALHRIFGKPMADNWVTTDNKGPLFKGKKPIQVMLDKGLPTIVEVYDYIDGLFLR